MSEILQTNIFFVIASVATIFFSIFFCIALFYVIKILRLIRLILQKIESGTEVLSSNLSRVGVFFAEGGLVNRLMSFFIAKSSSRSRRKKALEK